MYNDFVIIGPKEDPAKIKSAKTALAALKLIEQSNPALSRETIPVRIILKSLWKEQGSRPRDWYIEAGQGMGAYTGHRQRTQRLHHHRPRNFTGAQQARESADFD